MQVSSADVQIVGKLTGFKSVKQKRGSRLVAQFLDDSGQMELVWFRAAKWIQDSLKLNEIIALGPSVSVLMEGYQIQEVTSLR